MVRPGGPRRLAAQAGERAGCITLALAGDTMLGRGVAGVLSSEGSGALFAPEVVAATREADLVVLNLECCISERGEPWPDPQKAFFFRAPPIAVEALALIGVDCVTLANNHALDFGPEALLDTIELLEAAGIATVGAGADLEQARAPAVLEAGGFRLAVVGASDHPESFEAGPQSPGIALATLADDVSDWVLDTVLRVDADAVLVTPHWGPNMAIRPSPPIRLAAGRLLAAGTTLAAGHSAHGFHGMDGRALYDLGDFLDESRPIGRYATSWAFSFLVTLDAKVRCGSRPCR